MMVYLAAAAACAAAIAGYWQEPDSVAALCCLGLPVYVHATRGSRFRLDAVFTTTMLCAGGAAMAMLAALFWLSGADIAAAAAVSVLVVTAWVARAEVPVGLRVMRVALRGR